MNFQLGYAGLYSEILNMSMGNKYYDVVLCSPKMRYLLAGGWNTVFGYGVGVGLYNALAAYMHILLIGTIANIISISMSFITYKLFVFRTKGQWLREYIRTYIVYGGASLVGILLLWLLVDGYGLKIWLAQGGVIFFTVIISYTGHSRFTFHRAECKQEAEL
ncbi:MAG: GtrA family protein [Deltaproteobacteria bacterium]|nr:GtrA family protein [Deltaproteobacteria bacterium]